MALRRAGFWLKGCKLRLMTFISVKSQDSPNLLRRQGGDEIATPHLGPILQPLGLFLLTHVSFGNADAGLKYHLGIFAKKISENLITPALNVALANHRQDYYSISRSRLQIEPP